MPDLLERSTGWIVDRPARSSLLIAIVTAIAIAGYVHPTWLSDMFRQPSVELESPREESKSELPDVERFSLGGDVMLVVQSDQFFTPAGAAALRHVADTLESTDVVKQIVWMDRVPMLNIFGLPEPLFRTRRHPISNTRRRVRRRLITRLLEVNFYPAMQKRC